jgi:BNR/Asp-box repeat
VHKPSIFWRPKKTLVMIGAGLAVATGSILPAIAAASDVLVSNGSPQTAFPQNKQNEPAIAVDANNPLVLAAGSNDEIDLAPCNGNSCPFTPGIGVSGVYFSFDGGASWTQPTYTGRSARTGPTVTGPIGTLPNYAEAGLTSDGDPALAFGPAPKNGVFSWGNGSRLYYANLTSNLFAKRNETFKGFEGIAVSHTDNLAAAGPAASGINSAWSAPVIASRQASTTFSDKEQIWADNAASSPFFGNVYVCNAAFRSQEKSLHAVPAPLMLLKSSDGGNTWTSLQISSATNNGQLNPPDGCTIRTDSHGVVYVFGLGSGSNKQIGELLSRSFDGGKTFEPFRFLFSVVKPGVFDAALGRVVMDGIAGARADLAAAPSVDIANGAPTGADATNELLLNWSDAHVGLNHEQSMISYSTDQGQTWSPPSTVSASGDRPIYTAVAISPNGTDAYVTYDAFLTPYRFDTASPRQLQGVVTHADIGPGGAPTAFSELNRGGVGDPRGSSQNGLTAEFLGDYVYAVATRSYGAAVWNDTRHAADCPAIDAYRAGIEAGTNPTAPAPLTACPATWGNSDIFGGAYPDPTP